MNIAPNMISKTLHLHQTNVDKSTIFLQSPSRSLPLQLPSQRPKMSLSTAFGIYNRLFDYLERSTTQLAREKMKRKATMLSAFIKAQQKLSDYYAQTDQIHGDLYAVTTIMAPQNKFHFFSGTNLEGPYRTEYCKSLEKDPDPYQQRYLEQEPIANKLFPAENISDLDMLLTLDVSTGEQVNGPSKLS